MNSFPLSTVTIAALCTFGSAIADETSQRTRVDADYAARAAGPLGVQHGEDSGSFHLAHQHTTAALTRSEVQAQVSTARAAGELGARSAERSGSHVLALHVAPGTRSRDKVRSQLLTVRASGELQATTGEDSGSFHLAPAHAQDRPASIAER